MARKKKAVDVDADDDDVVIGVDENGETIDLSPEEKCALLLQSLTEIEQLTEDRVALGAGIKTLRKRLKAHGITNTDVNFALRLRKNKEEDELSRHRREIEVAGMINHPIGTQLELFEGVDRTPLVDRAYGDGKMAGMEGKVCKPPHDLATAAGQQWVGGWHDGQKTLASGIKKLDPIDNDSDDFGNKTVPGSLDRRKAVQEAASAI